MAADAVTFEVRPHHIHFTYGACATYAVRGSVDSEPVLQHASGSCYEAHMYMRSSRRACR